MNAFDHVLDGDSIPVRHDLVATHEATWVHLATPGSWFDGQQRVAIMAEVRNASGCKLCQARKSALSPYAVDGAHDGLRQLPDQIVELLHRVCTDPARLTPAWFTSVTGAGVTIGQYVEAVSVLAHTIAVDTFMKGLGLACRPLPVARPGPATGYRPEALVGDEAWVPLIDPEKAGEAEADLFPPGVPAANIRRAMSVVPNEVRSFFRLGETQYLPGKVMRNFDLEVRAISHAQIELVAGRVSSINGCVY